MMTRNEALARIFDAGILNKKLYIRSHSRPKYEKFMEMGILEKDRHGHRNFRTIMRWRDEAVVNEFYINTTITPGQAAEIIRNHWDKRLRGPTI